MLYYSILNLSQEFASTLPNIFVLAVTYSANLIKYGFDPDLLPFCQELVDVESAEGIKIDTNLCVLGSLCTFVTDTLAAHQLLRLQSLSANYFCRLCYFQKEEINCKFKEKAFGVYL